MDDRITNFATGGPLVAAIAVAVLAGVVSILSPCVLPLVPGYLSFVTGLAGSDLDASSSKIKIKGRVLAGTSLFVLGFTVVFVFMVTLVANVYHALLKYQGTLNIVLGVLVIVLGLGYLGLIPGLQREARIGKLPAAGLAGAPLFGAIFAISWTPCVGPTIGGITILASTGGTARAILLAIAFSLGLGLPFVLFGLFFQRLLGLFKAIRRNSRWVTRIGGALLILVGIALVTGGWEHFLVWLQTSVDPGGKTLL